MQCPVMDRRSATSPPSSASASAAEVSTSSSSAAAVEKEHMFEKVVTPSDVGKLNRLVIPKQHAERYFPASEREGLTLSFEDRDGKAWRFRYSYWNSSQSYVMTRGWSRFVKDKRLDAGDTVAFGRGVDDKGRFFIDCQRRRPPAAAAARIIDPPPPPAYRILWTAPTAAAYINAAAAAGTAFGSAAVDPRRAERGDGRMGAKRVRLFGVNLDSSPRNDSEIAFCSSPLRLLEGKEEEEDPSLDLQM